ncbi:type IV pili twitching motility protein PilT, partial [Cycloclasticus sp. 44_32_T64]
MDFDALLQLVVHKKASDLFITSGWAPTIKVNGVLQQVSKTRLSANQALDIVQSIMSDDQKQEFTDTKECQFAIQRPDIGRFRVSAFVQKDDAGMVLRRIETTIPTT